MKASCLYRHHHRSDRLDVIIIITTHIILLQQLISLSSRRPLAIVLTVQKQDVCDEFSHTLNLGVERLACKIINHCTELVTPCAELRGLNHPLPPRFLDTAHAFGREVGPVLAKFEVCDNIDLPTILQVDIYKSI